MKSIAIIGTGISGLGAAYLLQAQYRVTLYEKEPRAGGHARTLHVETRDNAGAPQRVAVDTGFIVFNHRNYPHLTALFKHLDVPTQKSDMTFGVTADDARGKRGVIEWGARNVNALFGQRRNLVRPDFYRMLRDIRHFNTHAVATLAENPAMTLGELLHTMGTGAWFLRYYLLPMGAAIWSCSTKQMLEFPARTFITFFENHGLLTVSGQPQWYTVTGGSRTYVERITNLLGDKIGLGRKATAITRILPTVDAPAKVTVRDESGETREYDHVILACHSDQALALLTDAVEAEKAALGAIRYGKNQAVLHRDAKIMPRRRRCWSSWVYHTRNDEAEPAISVTYWMNNLQSIPEATPLFVTLNPLRPIDPALILDEHTFEHPLFDQAALAGQQRLQALQGERQTWFCGAYLRYGFHEDGLLSAVQVAKKLGVEAPWA